MSPNAHPLSLFQRALKLVRTNIEDWRTVMSMRDVQSMLRVTKHQNIVTLYEVHRSACGNVWFVFEHMNTSLQDVISYCEPLSRSVIMKWMRELLLAVDHLHQAGYLHRDLKGDNVLISSDGKLKVSDFSLARGYHEVKHAMTTYISTRWFRAPEVLLGLPYGPPMDVFAAGCIFSEMHTKQPLFPATSQIDLLHRFMNVLGSSNPMVEYLTRRGLDVPPPTAASTIENLRQITNMPSGALELLAGLLHVDPHQRWTIDRAFQHFYFQSVPSPVSCAPSSPANTVRSVTVTPEFSRELNLHPIHPIFAPPLAVDVSLQSID